MVTFQIQKVPLFPPFLLVSKPLHHLPVPAIPECLFSEEISRSMGFFGVFFFFEVHFYLEFLGPVNTVKVISSWSVNLLTLVLVRHSPLSGG